MKMPKGIKYALIGVGITVTGLLIGWVFFPMILKSQIKKEMALSKKTDVRKMWETIPFPLDFKIYMFNYTNPEEVQKGGVPIVKEIGPYHFEEWKEKVELEENDAEDTITYKRRDTFLFKPEQSAPGLTGEEVVVIPHIIMVGMVLSVNREKPSMLNVIGKAIDAIFHEPTDVFLRVKVMDLLFKGFMIDCSKKEFAPKAVCTHLKKEPIPGMVWENKGMLRFSIFGGKNASIDQHPVTVKRGIQNVMEVGTVTAIDGEPEQKRWRGTCNEYQGTDGTVFPPFLTQADRMKTYSFDLCRSFKPWYQRPTFYRGIKTNRYIANIGDLANDPELNCFCEAPDNCPPKGLMDLFNCIKAPLYVSLPHFVESDPKLLNNVKGLNPDIDQHGIEIDFEPLSGTPLVAKTRVQFNIQLLKTGSIPLFDNLPDTIVPLFWIEEGLALNKTFINMLKYQLFIPKRVVTALRWWIVVIGCLVVLCSIIFHFKEDIMRIATRTEDSNVTKITPEEDEEKNISVISQAAKPAKISM